MKLTDEQIEQCRINAKASWNRHRFSIRGQQITPADDYEWHLIYWIESTVRQQDAELVRELVEALKHARGYSPVIAVAITRAQHWLGNI